METETKTTNGTLFWLKLEKDFFSQKEVKALRHAKGDTPALIYLEMMLLSVPNEGKLSYDGYEDTFEEEIALILGEDPEIVKETVAFLIKFGLLAKISDEEYLLTAVLGMTGKKTEAANRKEKSRANQKKARCDNVTSMSQDCHDTSQQCPDMSHREDKINSRPDLESEIEQSKPKEESDEEPIEENNQNESINECDVVDLVKEISGFDNDKFIYGKINELIISGYELKKIYSLITQNREKIEKEINYPWVDCSGVERAVDIVFNIINNDSCTNTINGNPQETSKRSKHTEQDVINYIISITGYNDQEYISKQLSEKFWISHYNVDEVYDCIKENKDLIELEMRNVDCKTPAVIDEVIDIVDGCFNGSGELPF